MGIFWKLFSRRVPGGSPNSGSSPLADEAVLDFASMQSRLGNRNEAFLHHLGRRAEGGCVEHAGTAYLTTPAEFDRCLGVVIQDILALPRPYDFEHSNYL